MSTSPDELSKAIKSLEEALSLHARSLDNSPEQKAFRDASIQRFEYCIELSWKISMKLLGSTTAAAKLAIREMARSNLIHDPSLWIDFIEARNNSSHSYDEGVAQKVFSSVKLFFPEAKALFAELQKIRK